MKKLAAYKLDKSFTDGVTIRLDNAPDVEFAVVLPSPYNRAYSQALYGAMNWSMEDGKVQTGGGIMDTRYAQEDAFLDHCLKSIDGEPAPENFRTDYPEALAELMVKAEELAEAVTDKVDTSVKKSPASSDGKDNGQDGRSSMTASKAVAG